MVNNINVEKPDIIYKYHIKNDFLFHQYIPCVEFDEESKLEPYSVSGEKWGDFLCKIFDLWYEKDTDKVSIRLFDSILAYFIDRQYVVCYMDRNCCQYFVVEHNGDVYPCDFHVKDDLKLGNIKSDEWEDFNQSKTYLEFGVKKNQWNNECKTCEYLNFCHGDCLKHRLRGYTKPESISHLCTGWKKFYRYTLPRFKILAEKFAKRREIVNAPPHVKIGRNDICPCGSGKKYKNCCLKFRRDFLRQNIETNN